MKENIIKMEEEEENVLQFRLAPGSGPPTGDNWVWGLDVGTKFLAKKNINSIFLHEFMVRSKTEKAIYLEEYLIDGTVSVSFYDPMLFSLAFKLYEITSVEG